MIYNYDIPQSTYAQEAFDELMKMSPEEIGNLPIDPIVEEIFDALEKMSQCCKVAKGRNLIPEV